MADGLRERQRQQTRREISGVATKLFLERGFEQVTISDVATQAGVAKMTVTNHFPRKEDLVFDRDEELVEGPVRAVRERAPGESALTAVRRAHLAAIGAREPTAGFAGAAFIRMIMESPTLRARLRELHEQSQEALAAVLADETGAGREDLLPKAVAGHLVTVQRVLFHEGFARGMNGEQEDDVAAALAPEARRLYDLLEPSLGDFAVRQG